MLLNLLFPLLRQVSLAEVSALVVTAGQRGANIIQEMGDGGFRVSLARPVLVEAPSAGYTLPPIQVGRWVAGRRRRVGVSEAAGRGW